LKAQGHRVTLVLTLDPQAPAYQPIHQAMLGYGVEECIENHGESSVEILQKLYASLDAFVFPSLCESFGFTLVEALYYGLPVIAADVRSYHDIADQAAMYFPARDAHQLARCMMSLQADSKRYEQMSLTALQRGQSYSWSKAAQELLGVMDQLIQGRA
ncbi:MAG: glycosyltransferase, partial [Gammaproteobacteria bacterium]|nr:glycosyltransferase [Gammaproteobacteria bacterium]